MGSWMTTHLTDLGVTGAAAWTSAFWLTVTVGRVLAAPVAQRVPLPTLVTACAVLACGALLLAGTALGPWAYLLAGVGIAPIFATSLGWFGQHLPTRLAPIVLACGGLGGTLFPALLGLLAARLGTDALPVGFAVTAALVALVALVLRAVLARAPRAVSTGA